MSYYEPLPDEKQRSENIRSVIWAICITFGLICSLVYGLAFLNWTEEKNEEIYARKNMQRNIEALSQRIDHMEIYATEILKLNYHYFEYLNHTHVYSTGKVKGGD